MRKTIWTLLLALLPIGCSAAQHPPLWQGDAPQMLAEQQNIVTSTHDWQQLWQHIGKPAPQSLPNDKTAIALFLGQKRTGGYSIEFVAVQQEERQTKVIYRIKTPPFNEMTAQVLTSPYAVTLIPRSDKPIILERQR